MDIFSLSSTAHYCTHTPQPFTATMLPVRHHLPSSVPNVVSLKQSSEPPDDPLPNSPRRPTNHKPTPKPPSSSSNTSKPRVAVNPLKSLLLANNNNPTSAPTRPAIPSPPLHTLTSKLRLSSKLSPPPPLPPTITEEIPPEDTEILQDSENGKLRNEFVEKGKIFVGNLPLWIKKNEMTEFFRQFGPIESVILIKGHNDTDRNMGFGFVIYGGPAAEKAAMEAVEFDGVEFHGRVLTVKLDDGRRLKEKSVERRRWVEGKEEGKVHKSNWHQEREGSRMELRRVIESQPENWQAVVTAFERIKKV